MYSGHVILLSVLVVALILVFVFQGQRKLLFPVACISIAIFFSYVSIQYYFDVFHNPMSDGFGLTWTMYLLTQNEDFVSRNGYYYGLYWGIGIVTVSLILAVISLIKRRRALHA